MCSSHVGDHLSDQVDREHIFNAHGVVVAEHIEAATEHIEVKIEHISEGPEHI